MIIGIIYIIVSVIVCLNYVKKYKKERYNHPVLLAVLSTLAITALCVGILTMFIAALPLIGTILIVFFALLLIAGTIYGLFHMLYDFMKRTL